MNYFELISDENALIEILNMPLNGYHCVKHGLGVSALAHDMAVASDFGESEVNSIAYAGLFHDASHSRNASTPDHRNLMRSLNNFNNFMNTHKVEEDVDVDLVGELILSTHSGLPGEYIHRNYSELEKILYDADTVDGLRVLSIANGEDDYLQALKGEGYLNAGGPISFINYRGLHSQVAIKKYGHYLKS